MSWMAGMRKSSQLGAEYAKTLMLEGARNTEITERRPLRMEDRD